MGDVIEQAEREVAVKPPTRWRNWFHSERSTPFYSGEMFAGPGPWKSALSFSSRDEAETRAAEWLAACHENWPGWLDEYGVRYLGAYPEGERPNV